MSLIEFGKISKNLARNPLGIISLFLVLVYGIAGLVTTNSTLDSTQQYILITFLVVFPFAVLFVFYKLVTNHHNKLYAPNDFVNEENFMKALEMGINKSDKINHLKNITDKIQKQINEQPLYRYTKLSEAGKQLILSIYATRNKENKSIEINEFCKQRKFDIDEVKTQAEKLSDEYDWINIKNNVASITGKGKEDLKTFITFVYGRFT